MKMTSEVYKSKINIWNPEKECMIALFAIKFGKDRKQVAKIIVILNKQFLAKKQNSNCSPTKLQRIIGGV